MVMYKNHRMQMRSFGKRLWPASATQPATDACHRRQARVQDGGSGQTRVATGLGLLLDGTACSAGRRFDAVGVLRRGGGTLLPQKKSKAREERRSGGAPMEDLRGR
jgi:hypothetical protein